MWTIPTIPLEMFLPAATVMPAPPALLTVNDALL
jgi:hypothetical protein